MEDNDNEKKNTCYFNAGRSGKDYPSAGQEGAHRSQE